MSWYLYVLECRDGSLYTGIAVDVDKRFAAHLAGKGARYTRAHPPLRVLARQAFPDRSSASRAEYAVKRMTPQQKREFCQHHAAAEAPTPVEASAAVTPAPEAVAAG